MEKFTNEIFENHMAKHQKVMDNIKIEMYHNPYGDTRTAPKKVSWEKFDDANMDHIDDVKRCMILLAGELRCRGLSHDYTKITDDGEKQFYKDFKKSINSGENFVNSDWYQYHIAHERHHLNARCPEDVNLLDVLEMIVDCTCAGLTRSGTVSDIEISNEILQKAVKNTQKYIEAHAVVVDKDKK